jgi:hypothetical protein
MSIRRGVWPIASLVLFASSLYLPAIRIDPHHAVPGWLCVELGWWTVPWYANVLLVLGAVARALAWHGVALVVGVLAIVVASCTFLYVGAAELECGFYVWLASLIAFAVGCADMTRTSVKVRTGRFAPI